MEHSKYKKYKSIKDRLQKGEKTTFAERNVFYIISDKLKKGKIK